MTMNKTIAAHLDAIHGGTVTRSNVIGIRKALNAAVRAVEGLSNGCSSPKVTLAEADALESAVVRFRPLVGGDLVETGLAVLRNKRHAKKLCNVAGIIAAVDRFRRVDFHHLGWWGQYAVPVYRAETPEGAGFDFVNVPRQSGGNGPEIVGNVVYGRAAA